MVSEFESFYRNAISLQLVSAAEELCRLNIPQIRRRQPLLEQQLQGHYSSVTPY